MGWSIMLSSVEGQKTIVNVGRNCSTTLYCFQGCPGEHILQCHRRCLFTRGPQALSSLRCPGLSRMGVLGICQPNLETH